MDATDVWLVRLARLPVVVAPTYGNPQEFRKSYDEYDTFGRNFLPLLVFIHPHSSYENYCHHTMSLLSLTSVTCVVF